MKEANKTMSDRRSGNERRQHARVRVEIEIEWETADGVRRRGLMNDISTAGCFVLTSGDVKDGDAVSVFLPMDGEGAMKAQFSGEVANHVFEIGFGVRFAPLSEAQWEFVERFVESAQNK